MTTVQSDPSPEFHEIRETQQSADRHLTIQSKYFPRSCHSEATFPEIRLAGKYLQQFGFIIGKKVTLHLEAGKLTITVDNPDSPKINGAEE
jgi:hypothetical protein